MTKTTMFKNYKKYNVADAYIIMFVCKHQLYMFIQEELMPRWIYDGRNSTSNGGGRKIQLYIPAADRKVMVKKGAVCLGADTMLKETPYKNRGHACEFIVWKYFGKEGYKPDSVPFYVDGDITIDNIKYQIKFEKSSICTEQTLEKCKQIFKKRAA